MSAKKKKATAKSKSPGKTEIVVRVESQPALAVIPTVTDLAEPMKDGKKLTLPKSWLASDQIVQMVQKTPPQHVYRRAGKGGQEFDYVTGSYVEKVLNFVFAWNWDFEVVSHERVEDFVIVLGKLTVRGQAGGQQIVKSQFGRAQIKKLKTGGMLDYGNDLKAAATDSLKKCASLLGIASDIYGKQDYKSETGREPKEAPAPVRATAPKGITYDTSESQEAVAPGMVKGPDGKPTHVCSSCQDPIGIQVAEYSKKVYGKRLCRDCQKNAKRK